MEAKGVPRGGVPVVALRVDFVRDCWLAGRRVGGRGWFGNVR